MSFVLDDKAHYKATHASPDNEVSSSAQDQNHADTQNLIARDLLFRKVKAMKKAEVSAFTPSLDSTHEHTGRSSLLIFVWVATLLASSLPDILTREFHIFTNVPLLTLKVGLLLVFIALGFVWKTAQPLRPYFALFLVLYLADAFSIWLGETPAWSSLFANSGTAFSQQMLNSQLLRLGVAFIMIAALWLIYRRRTAFFLSTGELNAPAQPVRWLGMDKPIGWRRFGLLLAFCITLGTLAFLFISGQPTTSMLTHALQMMPFIVLISAMNAFSEEVTYRASLLAPLYNVVGKSQALLLTAALFGLWHFYGVPYGVIGVVMAAVLGWLLGKSMLETKGIFWAWFIHFWQDVAIFTFLTAGSILPGGG